MTPQEMLLLPMLDNDAGAVTVGGYLQALLLRLWEEEEGFSGKRPFGNSGWQYALYYPLIKAGVVTDGKIDENEAEVLEEGDAYEVVENLIKTLFVEAGATDQTNKIIATMLRQKADEYDPRKN